MPQRTLYHVTPSANLDSIQVGGLDPLRSRGKTKATWLVTESRIPWALSHTSYRHGCSVGALSVCTVVTDQSKLMRTRLRGVWASKHSLLIRESVPALEILKPDIYQREKDK